MLERPLCIVGDVHLAEAAREPVGSALAALVANHPEHELVLNGDTFDLSADPPSRAPEESVASILSSHPRVQDALSAHLARGAPLTLVAGNHDAAIVRPAVIEALRARLGAGLGVVPWLLRRGSVHVEHGHLYDPDNAPTHPLSPWSFETEPLGVALTRRFVAPSGAWEFSHGDETTPLDGLLRTFRVYGLRAPLTVIRYYATAAALTLAAGRQPGVAEEREAGAKAVSALARELSLDADALRALALASANATHHRRGATFQRLYLDRSLATVCLAGSLAAALLGSPAGAGVAALAASYLGFSITRGTNRYGGMLERRLAHAAARIRELTQATLVVLGHSHRTLSQAGHLNPGSFGFPDSGSRRFALVERDGSARLGAL